MASPARPRRLGIALTLLLSVLLLSARVAPPARAADPVIAAAGDIACAPSDNDFHDGSGTTTACRQGATAGLLRSIAPTAVLTLGDNQYELGELGNFEKSFDLSWGQSTAPIHPSIGNREYRNGIVGAAQGYFSYFGDRAGDPSKGYYSYDVGNWHLVALNSNCSELDHATSTVDGCAVGSPQEQWLKADLAAHPASCTLAYWHHPLWTSATESMDGSVTPLWRDLYDAGADLVLNGHAHDYERFAPQTPDGALNAARGVREFVVGTGGKSHHLFDKAEGFEHSEIRNNTTFGVLQLSLHEGSYDWKFVPDPGSTAPNPPFTDSSSTPTPCHRPRADFSSSASPSPPSPNQAVAFDAAGSIDPDGTVASYSWDFGDGTSATTTDSKTSHQFATAGMKQVSLTITDSSGLKATTTRSVRVDAPPTPDFAFLPTHPQSGEAVSFDGTRSTDSDGRVATYAWDFDGDGHVDSIDPKPTHTFSAAGSHDVSLTVTDDLGLSRQVVKSVHVDAPPTAAFTATPTAPKTGEAVTFDASASKDPDGTIVSYDWDFGDGTVDTTSGAAPRHAFATAGQKTVRLTVTDDAGARTTTTQTVAVSDRAPAAGFTFSPTAPATGDPVAFDGSSSADPDGHILSYRWDFGDGTVDTTSGAKPTHSFATAGTKQVELTVTDDSGSTAATRKSVTIANRPPAAAFAFSPASPQPGGAVAFDGSGSRDPDGHIASYRWDFGDGTSDTTSGAKPTHSFATGGNKVVRLTVTDDGGLTGTITRTVAVATGAFPQDPFPPPRDVTPPTVSVVVPRRSLATVVRKGLDPSVRCSEACRVVLTLDLPRSAAAALGLRPHTASVTIGRGTLELRAAGRGRVVVKLTRRAQSALRRVRYVRVTLRTTAVDPAGNKRCVSRTISLRRR